MGQGGPFEGLQNFLIGCIAQGDGVEVVLLHELVEDVRADDHCFGNVHVEVVGCERGIPLHERPHECQAASLAAQRAVADAGEVAVLVEAFLLVDGHHAGILHFPVAHDDVEDELPRLVHVGVLVGIVRLQDFGGREHGARVEEARKMVVRQVVAQGVVRNLENLFLQILQVLDAKQFPVRVGVVDDEVAEAEVLHDLRLQVLRVAFGAFRDERCAQLPGIAFVLHLARLQDERYMAVDASQLTAQTVARQRVLFPFARETHVRNHAQDVVGVRVEDVHRLFVGACQHNLGAAPHAQHLQVVVEGLLREFAALFEHHTVQVGQGGGVEADGVFHQQDGLHAHRGQVVGGVQLVLNQFDDGQQQFRVAEP